MAIYQSRVASLEKYTYLPLLKQFITEKLKQVNQDSLYAQGYALYQQGRYREALPFFTWLVGLMDTKEGEKVTYYAALAACQKMIGEYEKAINNYAMALLLQPEQIEYKMHIAECQIGGQYLGGAYNTLTQILALKAASVSSAQKWIEKAQSLLTLLQGDVC